MGRTELGGRVATRFAAGIVAIGLLVVMALPSVAQTGGRVRLADETQRCLPSARVRTAFPVGFGGCPGVRPGAYFESPVTGCTFNFLFRGRDGSRYIGSAGHCLLSDEGAATWSVGSGPVIRTGEGVAVGRGVYAIQDDDRDFSLIRLEPGVKASPQMCHFGGPTAIDDEHASGPVALEHYGQGVGVSTLTPGRTAVAVDTRGEDVVAALGVATYGDSGSGVTRGGRALGVLVALNFGTAAGNLLITRLAPQLAEAEREVGTELVLMTAPRL